MESTDYKLKLTEIMTFVDKSAQQLHNINMNLKHGGIQDVIIIDADEQKAMNYVKVKLIEIQSTATEIGLKLKTYNYRSE